MVSLLSIHTSFGLETVVDVEFPMPMGDPTTVVAFDAQTVIVQFEVEIDARIKQETSKKAFSNIDLDECR
jgi:hypothetical protein